MDANLRGNDDPSEPFRIQPMTLTPRFEWNSSEVHQRLRDRQQDALRKFANLTLREQQVLQFVATGHANKVVAMKMAVSIKTVEKHRASVMRKLRLQSFCDLLRFWFFLTWDELLSEPSPSFGAWPRAEHEVAELC